MCAPWSSDAVEHERYYGLGMDALVIGCSAWQSSMMVVVFEVHGCTRGHVALLSTTPLRAHLDVKCIVDLLAGP